MKYQAARTQSLTKIRVRSDSDLSFDMQKILQNPFQKFAKLLSGIKPLHNPHDVPGRQRNDVIEPSLAQADALANTQKRRKGYFVSSRTIPSSIHDE